MVGPPEETEPSGESEYPPEHEGDQDEPETDTGQDPLVAASDQELQSPVVPVVDSEIRTNLQFTTQIRNYH